MQFRTTYDEACYLESTATKGTWGIVVAFSVVMAFAVFSARDAFLAVCLLVMAAVLVAGLIVGFQRTRRSYAARARETSLDGPVVVTYDFGDNYLGISSSTGGRTRLSYAAFATVHDTEHYLVLRTMGNQMVVVDRDEAERQGLRTFLMSKNPSVRGLMPRRKRG